MQQFSFLDPIKQNEIICRILKALENPPAGSDLTLVETTLQEILDETRANGTAVSKFGMSLYPVCFINATSGYVAINNEDGTLVTYFFNDSFAFTGNTAPATVIPCPGSTTSPGMHLGTLTANGSLSSPFPANCVTVSYDAGMTAGEITVVLSGAIAGNKTFKVYANNEESICFSTPIITGVTITGVTSGTVDIEFQAK